MVRLRVAPELRLFLPAAARRAGVVDLPHRPTDSLGHVVQSAGVPLTEVGALRIGGEDVPERSRPAPDAVVDVLARPRPQPLDGPPRLLLDVHLGRLARRLRLLGVDVAYRNDASDDALVEQAAREDRLLLTQDRGLLRRRALRRAAYVRGSDPDAQVDDVLDRFRLPLRPFTVCTACGGDVEPVAKSAVLHRLEPGTRRTQQEFARCRRCRRVYWRGAHARRLDELVRRHGSAGGGETGRMDDAGSRRTAAEVFDDHLERADRGDVDGDLASNYAEDVVVLSSYGVERGRDGARRLADLLARQLPSARFAYPLRLVEGEVALLEWTAEADGARVRDGVDSFVIRGGRIVAQTLHYTVEPR